MTRRLFPRSARCAALLAAFLSLGTLPACGPSSPRAEPAPQTAPTTTGSTTSPTTGSTTDPTTGSTTGSTTDSTTGSTTTPITAPAPAPVAAASPIIAIFECESGTFRAELATKEAPRLCANFINLVNRGYYDGQAWVDFSRVVRQTGLNPAGDPAYSLPREFGTNLFFDKPGRLCFSNNSDDVSTARAKPTRIFVTVRPQDRWNLQYAVFGTIVDGLDVAMNLKDGEKIIRVRVEGDFAAHQARFAKQIAEWNAALDKVGLVDRR